MTKKTTPSRKDVADALTHNPFASLAAKSARVAPDAGASAVAPIKRPQPSKPLPAPKVRVRMETTGRSGKVVTRMSGLPIENLAAIASRLRKALGCGATIQDNDVLLLGSLADRALQWLERVGDLHAIKLETPAPKLAEPSVVPGPGTAASTARADGTKRSDVRRGQRVAIVMKADQISGALTEGVVRDLLTSSETHPRGIKVRLESGEVGRVKVVLG